MIAGCKTFHLAVSGDYCYLIASDAGIDVATLQEWNPDLGSDCTVLLGYYYCIGL
jgi:LysM repeat protein